MGHECSDGRSNHHHSADGWIGIQRVKELDLVSWIIISFISKCFASIVNCDIICTTKSEPFCVTGDQTLIKVAD